MINLNHLNYFIDLAKTLSFSQTGRNLNIAQPAVSRAIKTLEENLGVNLFLRSNKKVHLSEAGKQLLLDIRGPFECIEQQLLNTSSSAQQVKGSIRIGCLHEFGEYKVVPLISKFYKLHSAIQIELIYAGNQELEQLLKAGEIDYMFGITPLAQENIKTYKLLHQSSYLVTSINTPLKDFQLKEVPFIVYRRNDPLLERYLSLFHPNISMSKVNKHVVLNSHIAMVQMLTSHAGHYAVLPEFSQAVTNALNNKTIKIASPHCIETTIFFSYWYQQFIPLKFKIFQEFVKENI